MIPSKQASFKPVIYQKEEKESSVVLYWDQKLHDYHYTSYWVESSTDGINYTRLTEVPFVQMTDQKITTHKKYYSFTAPNTNYQKKALQTDRQRCLGDESLPSEAIMAMGRDKTPPPVPSLYADTLMNHLTKNLYWTLDNPSDIAALHLERSFGDKTETLLNWAKPNEKKNRCGRSGRHI
ncbi:MAG: hypothetical protein IPO65_20975 [Saprospiraceae bacterium]|nr:hypothetical protein [Saprospiraceae bacterium]